MSKNKENRGRKNVGVFAGLVGLFCNLVLSAAKLVAGFITGSVSIMTDAINNLSDGGSSIVTISSFVFSGKKADREHPHGHGRFEYVASFIVGFLVLFAGLQFLIESIKKIIEPTSVRLSVAAIIILGLSVFVKLFMALFYRAKSKKLNSDALKAASLDSLFDILCTLAVLVSFVLDSFLPLKTDGICGVLVSIVVLVGGGRITFATMGKLLGNGGDIELIKRVYSLFEDNEMVLAAHELKLHEYGHDICIGSVHVEMDKDLPLLKAHEVIHELERRAKTELNVELVIHIDPVDFSDPSLSALRKAAFIVISHYHGATIHDAQVFSESKRLLLHVKLPVRYQELQNDIASLLSEQIKKSFEDYVLETSFEILWE